MILITVGTNEQPFDRLVRAAAELGGEEHLLVQYGSSRVEHGRGEWVNFLSFDELAERAQHARVFISHAGVGSIMLARRCGHRPIVVPRRRPLHEAVDDHQLVLARRLAEVGSVTLLEDERALEQAIQTPTAITALQTRAAVAGVETLSADVRAVLAGLGAAPLLEAPAAQLDSQPPDVTERRAA